MTIVKRLLFPTLAVFVAYFFYSFTSDDEKYEIINEIARDNDLTLFKICSKTVKIKVFDNNLSDFAPLAQLSVTMQKITQKEAELEPGRIKYFDNRQRQEVPSEIVSDCGKANDMLYVLSMPIVSPDKKTVLLKITENCNCILGGQSGTYLYKKIDGKWKQIKSFDSWISGYSPRLRSFAFLPLPV